MSRKENTPGRDPRGFQWPLQPLRNKREWELESARAALGRAQQALAQAEAGVRELELRYRSHSQAAAEAMHARLEPASHGGAMQFLLGLANQTDQAREELDRATAQVEAARKAYIERQLQLDGLTARRDEARLVHVADERRRAENEADRDWLSRVAGAAVSAKAGAKP